MTTLNAIRPVNSISLPAVTERCFHQETVNSYLNPGTLRRSGTLTAGRANGRSGGWFSFPAPKTSLPNRVATRLVALLAVLLVAGAAFTGCITTPAGVDRLARIAGSAAEIGTSLRLTRHPGERPLFVASSQAITTMLDTASTDQTAFAEALANLPINQFKGVEGQLLVSLTVLVWDEVAQSVVRLKTPEEVRKVMLSVRDGLWRALARH